MTQILRRETAIAQAPSPELFAQGLRRYVAEVASALGVGPDSCTVNVNSPATVHLALNVTLPRYPGRNVALVWHERTGWFAVAAAGATANVIAYRGGDLLPYPADVTSFVAALAGGRRVGQTMPPHMDATARDDMMTYRLRSYLR